MERGRGDELKNQIALILFPQLCPDVELPDGQNQDDLREWLDKQEAVIKALGGRVPNLEDLSARDVEERLRAAAASLEPARADLLKFQAERIQALGHGRIGAARGKSFESLRRKWMLGLLGAGGVFLAEWRRRLDNAWGLDYSVYGRDDGERSREIAHRLRQPWSTNGGHTARVERYEVDPRLGILKMASLVSYLSDGAWNLNTEGVLTVASDSRRLDWWR